MRSKTKLIISKRICGTLCISVVESPRQWLTFFSRLKNAHGLTPSTLNIKYHERHSFLRSAGCQAPRNVILFLAISCRVPALAPRRELRLKLHRVIHSPSSVPVGDSSSFAPPLYIEQRLCRIDFFARAGNTCRFRMETRLWRQYARVLSASLPAGPFNSRLRSNRIYSRQQG